MIEHVDADRLRDLTLELVEIESPTGDTAVVARRYAQRLEEIGMEVEVLDEVFPATPIVIGRLRGGEPGPSVVLNGHLDTVPIPHEPARVENGSVYGRGSADMKGALACAAETARVLEAVRPVSRRARDHRDRDARGAGRPGRGSHVAAARARLPLRLRRRLRAERRHLRGGAHGPGDGRDHDLPSRASSRTS